MLLTLSASSPKPNLDLQRPTPHASSPLFSPPPSARIAHKGPNSASSHRPLQASGTNNMSAPHRGLPPPSAMALPDPSRGSDASRGLPPSMSHFQSPGQQHMPAPPPQWQGAEDSMKNWLATRAEEERRKQEEEKTRQENLRLEQRRIEQSMLRESMAAGVPPNLIPVIFAGISGTNVGFEVLQNYYAHLQNSAPQIPPQGSPDARRDSRLLGQHQAVPPPTTHHPHHQPQTTPGLQHESHGAPPHAQHQSQHPPASSPSIYFHHWVPPSSQAGASSAGNAPPTPSDHSSISPKKRKAQGSHPPPPPPSSSTYHASPTFSSSTTSTPGRRGHGRTRSDMDSGSQPTSHPGSGNLGSSGGRDTGHGSGSGGQPTDPSRREGSVDVAAASSSLAEQLRGPQTQQQSRRTSWAAEAEVSGRARGGDGSGSGSTADSKRKEDSGGAHPETMATSSQPSSPRRPPETATD